ATFCCSSPLAPPAWATATTAEARTNATAKTLRPRLSQRVLKTDCNLVGATLAWFMVTLLNPRTLMRGTTDNAIRALQLVSRADKRFGHGRNLFVIFCRQLLRPEIEADFIDLPGEL